LIGNDLVYIPGWSESAPHRHQRFKDKLFLPSEQELLKSLPVWGEPLLWSMKEATYKLVFRTEPSYRYAPKSLRTSVQDLSADRIDGLVNYKDAEFLTQSWRAESYIHTIALPIEQQALFDQVRTLIAPRKRDSSDYQLAISKSEALEIVKDNAGIPHFKGTRKSNSCVSISHDEDRIAYAWLMGYTNE
jgi:phosphopantetheinyl transferase (holo-ACP synthase)